MELTPEFKEQCKEMARHVRSYGIKTYDEMPLTAENWLRTVESWAEPAKEEKMPIARDCPADGMTYRQWLIGQALNGIMASEAHNKENDQGYQSTADIAAQAINCADCVLKLLEGEAKT